MKQTTLSILLLVSTFISIVIVSCAARQIPRYSQPIFTLDNSDPKNIVLRYRGNDLVMKIDDPRVQGSVVFLPLDFVEWNRTYVEGCLNYDPSLPFIESSTPSDAKATTP